MSYFKLSSWLKFEYSMTSWLLIKITVCKVKMVTTITVYDVTSGLWLNHYCDCCLVRTQMVSFFKIISTLNINSGLLALLISFCEVCQGQTSLLINSVPKCEDGVLVVNCYR